MKKQLKIRKVSLLKYVLFHCAHTLDKNTNAQWELCHQGFGVLPLIFSISK